MFYVTVTQTHNTGFSRNQKNCDYDGNQGAITAFNFDSAQSDLIFSERIRSLWAIMHLL